MNVIMKNYCDMAVGGLGFWAIGYGLMFGSNSTGWFGTTKFFLNSAEPFEFSMLFFQMMFAATAATIVSGALAERIRFSAYLIGSLVITAAIYPVFGSWAWNDGGWLKKLGFIDFAGSTVVHSVGAWAALAGAIALGPRSGRFKRDGSPRIIPGHNLPMVALGGFILWFGWFGFNAGSTGEVNASIGQIALNTHLAGAAGALSAVMLCLFSGRPPLITNVINASLGGLVGVTAGCAFVSPGAAIVIGLVAGLLAQFGALIIERFGIDYAVGAIPVHGFCGVWGTLAVALFKDGAPDVSQFAVQAIGCGAAFLLTFPVAFLTYKLISLTMPLRVSTVDEQRGLDYSEHGEIGYPEFQESLLHSGGLEEFIATDAPERMAVTR